MNSPELTTTPASCRFALAGFMCCLALTLLAPLDVRRGFLLPDYPVRTFFYVFTPSHALIFAAGVEGMPWSYRGLRNLEAHLADTSPFLRVLTLSILA